MAAILGRLWEYFRVIYSSRIRPRMEERMQQFEPYYNLSKTIVFHGVIVFVFAAFCLYISAFLFGVLYFYNMPTIHHSFDLNFQYNRQCIQQHRNYLQTGKGNTAQIYRSTCFPTAIISFDSLESKSTPHPNQEFMVYLILDLPESVPNLDIGMFMVTMNYEDLVSSQPVSIKYRPFLIRLASTVFYWPLLLFDLVEAKQTITVPLFDRARFRHKSKSEIQKCVEEKGLIFEKNCKHRTAEIKIDYPDIQIYSAELQITAIFSGLQYFLYQWPVFSFLVGTAIFFVPVLASGLVICSIILWNPYRRLRELVISGNTVENLRRRRNGQNHDNNNDEGPQEVPVVEVIEDEEIIPNNDGEGTSSSSTTSSIEIVGSNSAEIFKKDDDQPSTSQSEYFDDGVRKRK